MDNRKKMWRCPWQYRESLVVTAALLAGGLALQWSIGPLDAYFARGPVNLGLAALIILWAAASLGLKKYRAVQWLAGVHLASALILALLVLSLVMGLTPQGGRPLTWGGGLFSRLGFTGMTSSWPFLLVYLAVLVSLSMAAARRLGLTPGSLVFFLNHAGLWLVLAAAGLGAPDRARHVMYVEKGQVEWRVYSRDREVLELPLAIRLDEFDLEEYPPRLAVVNRETGQALPKGRPELYQISQDHQAGRLLDWELTLLEYIHRAVPAGEGRYREAARPDSAPAAKVALKNRRTGEERQGWVSAGHRFLPVSTLALDERAVLVMTQPEPRRFTSKIKVFTRDGLEREALLEVNRPLRAGDWLIYQYGYDNQAGRMSGYSSFELVYDPWLYAAYAGLALWALGALGLIGLGRGRKESGS